VIGVIETKKLSFLKFPLLLDTIGVSLAQLAKREKYLKSNTHTMTLGNPRTFNRQDSSSTKKSDELDEFARAKLERDLVDLQRLIGAHFEERQKDEEDLVDLKDRIAERKEMRAAQIQERARKQQERDLIKKMEKEKKEAVEEERRLAEEQKRKAAMEAMSMSMSCKSARKERKGKRAMDKEKKKKILSERRKILNVDHLQTDKLMEKIREIYDWLCFLEEDKLNLEIRSSDMSRELKQLRMRINDLSDKKTNKLNLRK